MTYINTIKRMKPVLKITDLVDSKYVVELHDSEMKNITGGLKGDCSPRGQIVTDDRGYIFECQDSPLWFADQWVNIGRTPA